jgi:hypothetical protein
VGAWILVSASVVDRLLINDFRASYCSKVKIKYRGISLQMDRHWNRISALHAFIGFVSLFTPMHYISSICISFDPDKDPEFLHFNMLVLCISIAKVPLSRTFGT